MADKSSSINSGCTASLPPWRESHSNLPVMTSSRAGRELKYSVLMYFLAWQSHFPSCTRITCEHFSVSTWRPIRFVIFSFLLSNCGTSSFLTLEWHSLLNYLVIFNATRNYTPSSYLSKSNGEDSLAFDILVFIMKLNISLYNIHKP